MLTRFLRLLFPLVCACALPGLVAAPPTSELAPEYVAAVRESIRQFGNRDFPATLEALDKAEAMQPPSPLTLNTRGAVLIEQRKFEEGRELCNRALKLDPKFYPARFNLCEIPMMQKQYAEARIMFQALLDEFPTDELVMFRILVTRLMEKNDPEARRMLDRIPFPGKTAAYYYGNAAWEFAHGNEEEATKWMKRGNWVFNRQMTINFSDALKEVGWLTAELGATDVLPDLTPQGVPNSSPLELPKMPQPEPAAPFGLEKKAPAK